MNSKITGDINNSADIRLLIDKFQGRIGQDALLAEMFAHVKDTRAYKEKLYEFWNAALLDVGPSSQEPFPLQDDLQLSIQHLIRWRTLFFETLNSLFAGPVCERAKVIVIRRSEQLLSRLELTRF